ncbi:GNAT family N-acetyltransferase [Ornithinimicrobium cavernae]|uniref:GNAT family N-acetyltransferase n=1 Tax=Ornithinimicrobium cavernae TaxID=2666047 RepID=UPI000D68CE7D|nr:GNAT family N-acetyltransferase [Ornithinimicrobium cavernae]
MTWHVVDRAALLGAAEGDAYVELACGTVTVGAVGEHGWAALHRWRPTGHWGGAAVVGPNAPPDAESEALQALLEAAPDVPLEWFSTANGRELRLPTGLEPRGSGRWDFLTTRTAPQQAPPPQGLHVVELDDTADAVRLQEFGRRHNPDFEGFPGRGFSMLWRAVVDQHDELVGIGALHELDTGIPHLSGLVVAPAHRGRGLGRLLTSDLTRQAMDLAGVCTLGVYTDNQAAIALYHSLGYRTHHSFHTRDVARRGARTGPTYGV